MRSKLESVVRIVIYKKSSINDLIIQIIFRFRGFDICFSQDYSISSNTFSLFKSGIPKKILPKFILKDLLYRSSDWYYYVLRANSKFKDPYKGIYTRKVYDYKVDLSLQFPDLVDSFIDRATYTIYRYRGINGFDSYLVDAVRVLLR